MLIFSYQPLCIYWYNTFNPTIRISCIISINIRSTYSTIHFSPLLRPEDFTHPIHLQTTIAWIFIAISPLAWFNCALFQHAYPLDARMLCTQLNRVLCFVWVQQCVFVLTTSINTINSTFTSMI